MTEAKLAPNLPDWMVQHANRYLSSGGTEGHLYKLTPPGRPEMNVPSLLLTTTGRKSGERFIFPLFYGETGDGRYIVVASPICQGVKCSPYARLVRRAPETTLSVTGCRGGTPSCLPPWQVSQASGHQLWSTARKLWSRPQNPGTQPGGVPVPSSTLGGASGIRTPDPLPARQVLSR